MVCFGSRHHRCLLKQLVGASGLYPLSVRPYGRRAVPFDPSSSPWPPGSCLVRPLLHLLSPALWVSCASDPDFLSSLQDPCRALLPPSAGLRLSQQAVSLLDRGKVLSRSQVAAESSSIRMRLTRKSPPLTKSTNSPVGAFLVRLCLGLRSQAIHECLVPFPTPRILYHADTRPLG